jgi:phosphopantetheine--protein transferase-like protein
VQAKFALDLPHGHCVAVEIPPMLTYQLRGALHPEEQAFVDRLGPGRQASFAAGRAALRAALAAVAPDPTAAAAWHAAACLPDPQGAPSLPAGALASISHKRTLAIALAAPAPADSVTFPRAALGVDLEEDRTLKVDISRRVLTANEHARLAALPAHERDRSLIQHFSLKEAFYKAVNGFELAHVSFHDVEVTRIYADGTAEFAAPVLLEQQLTINGWIGSFVDGHVVASVRAVRAG